MSEVDDIARLGIKLHGGRKKHAVFTFGSMLEHVQEIDELLRKGDGHWSAEAVDLMIHCLLLLRTHGVSKGEIERLQKARLNRFREKITLALYRKKSAAKGKKHGKQRSGS